MSCLQASGDALWALVEEDGYFPEDLKLILKATKFDNLFSLSRFDMDKDLKEIESFMQNILPTVIPSSKYEEYYSIFKDNPKSFVFVGGLRAALKLLVNSTKSIIASNKKRLNSNDNVSDTNTSSKKNKVTSNSEPTNKSICDGKADLEKTIKNYIAANYPPLKDNEIVCKVVRDGLGSLVAEANCPVKDCKEMRKITRNVTRWNTSNYYAHIKSHFGKRNSNNLSKKVTPIDSVFKPIGGQSRRTKRRNATISSDESDADNPNGEETIENDKDTERERESGNEKAKSSGGATDGDMIENNSPEESSEKQRCDDSSSNTSF